jgi:hypothetical protein
VTLRLYRRAGTPGEDRVVLGPRIALPVRTTASRAAMRLPRGIRPDALWLQARAGDGSALVPLGTAP